MVFYMYDNIKCSLNSRRVKYFKLRIIWIVIFFLGNIHVAISQSDSCSNAMDTAEVVKIAKHRNAYWVDDDWRKPSLLFNGQQCEWTVQSTKTRYTSKGDCKRTNGCTEITTVTLVIEANTKKVKSKKKEKRLFPNYE